MKDEHNRWTDEAIQSFRTSTERIKSDAIKNVKEFLATQKQDVELSVESQLKHAKMNDDRVLIFSDLVYAAGGTQVLNDLQQEFNAELIDLVGSQYQI